MSSAALAIFTLFATAKSFHANIALRDLLSHLVTYESARLVRSVYNADPDYLI
jgi:hypothetical protein